MKVFVVLALAFAAVSAASLPVVPVESSVVKSERSGDSFAYSVQENRGYVAPIATPIVKSFEYVKPVEYIKPAVELKSFDYKPFMTYAASPYMYNTEFIKPIEYKTEMVKPFEYKMYAPNMEIKSFAPTVEVKSFVPKMEIKEEMKTYADKAVVASGYYGVPSYSAYPYTYNTYPYSYYPSAYPFGFVKADK